MTKQPILERKSKASAFLFDGDSWPRLMNKVNSCGIAFEKKPWQTWEAAARANSLDLSGFDAVIMLGGSFIGSKATPDGNYLSDIWKGRFGIGFNAAAGMLFPHMLLLHSCQEHQIPFHHIVWDPLEANSTGTGIIDDNLVNMYWTYEHNARGYKRLDSFQYGLEKQKSSFSFYQEEKQLDFVFGMSIQDLTRELVYDNLMRTGIFAMEKSALFFSHARLGRDNTVSRTKYTDALEIARFTFIVPSYDTNFFSFYRFADAISRKCLPLLSLGNNMSEVVHSYKLDSGVINELTMKDWDIQGKISSISEIRRLELLDYLSKQVLPPKFLNLSV